MAKKKKTRTRASTLGASYRAASTGIILAAPAIGKVVTDGIRDPKDIAMHYRAEAKGLAIGIGVHALDSIVGQKVFNHNSALGRGSVTAWIAEGIATVPAAIKGAAGERGFGTSEYSLNKTGYYPNQGWIGIGAPGFKNYLGAKYILGAVRKVSNMGIFSTVAQPIKRMLSSAGGAL